MLLAFFVQLYEAFVFDIAGCSLDSSVDPFTLDLIDSPKEEALTTSGCYTDAGLARRLGCLLETCCELWMGFEVLTVSASKLRHGE